ncbi:hypothetical protein F5878DRAFT_644994 [Lentinula raphanica]|uniref:TEA domain-containing protein n=1 Tax=Lentinula raphanica TaxID=153919 RepID=A0AA38P1J8_9AGAR|nr:hypothetical protein F5878DRAFT_644994 [Lentinula raphanica]
MADEFPYNLSSVYNESSSDLYRSTLESTSHFTTTTAKSALTPLRKHHKLLKDGSGNEVWPEFVEKIFVDGLRAYAASTVSQNHAARISDAAVRGRSRLRNAYLVKYLVHYEIERTRKQVASHLQVLKNMWRAEGNYANFSLVVGSDSSSVSQTQPSNSENTASRRPSSHSVSSTSSGSSKLSFATASPQVWSRTMTSPYSTPGSSVNSSSSGVRQPYEANSRALQSPNVRSSGIRTIAGDGSSISTAMNLPPHIDKPHHHKQFRHRQQPEPQPSDVSDISFIQAPDMAVVPHGAAFYRSSRHRLPDVPMSPSLMSLPMLASNMSLISTKLYLFTEGMIPLTVDLEQLSGSGVVSLQLQLDIPELQAVSSAFSGNTIQPGFTARLEAVCPVGRLTSPIICKCITYVWGPRSSHTDYSFQAEDPMAYKKSPIFYETSMLCRKSPSMMQVSTHTEPHQLLVCLSKEEAEIQADILQSEQEISTTAYGQVTIFNFPESVLPTCRLFEQAVGVGTFANCQIKFRCPFCWLSPG